MPAKPIKLKGAWNDGYALDYHIVRSEFMGYDDRGHALFDTERTELGELLYQLKYRGDTSVIDKVVKAACDFVTAWKIKPDLIVPVPPSRAGRRVQPVSEIAKGMGANLNVAVSDKIVLKVKQTPELKNVVDYQERLNLLKDAYDVRGQSLKGKTVLIVDDLFRSGATLNALTEVLLKKGQANKVFVLALTRTRSTP